ncbi:TPA: hypothetical protein ACH3X1_013918 [Trebouxia sp. C0004]
MHWLIAAFSLQSSPPRLVLTCMSLTISPWSYSYCSAYFASSPTFNPSPHPRLGVGQQPAGALCTCPPVRAAPAHQHSLPATFIDGLHHHLQTTAPAAGV